MKIDILNKIKIRIRSEIIKITRKSFIYPFLYKSFWHSIIVFKHSERSNDNYLTAFPNQGAGIGHQIANWNAGLWFANTFNLKYAYSPFSSEEWDKFLAFGDNEIHYDYLLKKGFKSVRIPLFDENCSKSVNRTNKIIDSYGNKRIVFVCEQDQFYQEQFGVIDIIKKKFHNAKVRKQEHLIFSKDTLNIAVHIRRGDITVGQKNKNPNLVMRWADNAYYVNVLKSFLEKLIVDKPIAIYLFSQGQKDEFKEFIEFSNLNYCLKMGAKESFLHMVYADCLITSKSSFSYKPALLSNGLKISPINFWHNYPKTKDWYLVNEKGEFIDNVKFQI